jgi:hypothetical protein
MANSEGLYTYPAYILQVYTILKFYDPGSHYERPLI